MPRFSTCRLMGYNSPHANHARTAMAETPSTMLGIGTQAPDFALGFFL
jgi:hypothetical protein